MGPGYVLFRNKELKEALAEIIVVVLSLYTSYKAGQVV